MAERIRLLVTVKAYPAASVKYGEAVCVAGVRTDTPDPRWVRLYPVGFRDMPIDKRFEKYEEISLVVSLSGDSRPESAKPDTSSIEVLGTLGTRHDWRERRRYVEPLVRDSMCAVLAEQAVSGRSLGAFRPAAVKDFVVERQEPWTAKQLNTLNQLSLFAQDKTTLERVPWRFSYRYSCGSRCRDHVQSIIDWEIHQTFRKWRRLYGEAAALERIRRKWLDEMCGTGKDTTFFVGNQHLHPQSFLVLGVFWPPKRSGDVEYLQLRFDDDESVRDH